MLLSRWTGNYVHKQWIIWFYVLFFIQNLREKLLGYWKWCVGKLLLSTQGLLPQCLVWWSCPGGPDSSTQGGLEQTSQSPLSKVLTSGWDPANEKPLGQER